MLRSTLPPQPPPPPHRAQKSRDAFERGQAERPCLESAGIMEALHINNERALRFCTLQGCVHSGTTGIYG